MSTAPAGSPGGIAHLDVLIVGAGLSGIGAAWHLRRRLPAKSSAILEARAAGGGTWDLSRERLGKRAGLHRTEIGKLENGERVCRIDTLTKLAGSMAVPPEELLDGIFWVSAPESDGTFTFGGDGLRRRIGGAGISNP